MTVLDRPTARSAATVARPSAAATALVAAAAAAPALVAAVVGGGLILDDLEFAARARFDGWAGFTDEMLVRPGQGFVHWFQFTLLGTSAPAHLVVLGILNALAAVAAWFVARRHLAPVPAAAVTGTWVVLPNRGATHYWVSTVPNLVALVLVLGALLVTSAGIPSTRRRLAAAGLVAVAVGTYEGAMGLGLLTLLVAGRGGGVAATLRRTSLLATPSLALALFALVRSPRRESARLGVGVVDSIGHHLDGLRAWPVGPLLVLGLMVGLVAALLVDDDVRAMVAAGALVVAAGLAPFLAGGFPVGPSGVLDRGNLYADLGTALIIGAGFVASGRRLAGLALVRSVAAAIVVGLASVAVLHDLGAYRAAAEDARDLGAELAATPVPDEGGTVAVPLPENHGGVVALLYQVQLEDLYRLSVGMPEAPDWLVLDR